MTFFDTKDAREKGGKKDTSGLAFFLLLSTL